MPGHDGGATCRWHIHPIVVRARRLSDCCENRDAPTPATVMAGPKSPGSTRESVPAIRCESLSQQVAETAREPSDCASIRCVVMLDYLIRRLIGTIPVLLAVSAFVFLFVHLLPGDPARLVAGPDASLQDIAAVRADMGLDKPLLAQYVHYLGQTLQLRLGRSARLLSATRPRARRAPSPFRADNFRP